MPSRRPSAIARLLAPLLACSVALACAACGSAGHASSVGRAALTTPATTTPTTDTATTTPASTTAPALPGTGKPAVVIGDKNFTEQFVLGELYDLALQADGFSVSLNRNIGLCYLPAGEARLGRAIQVIVRNQAVDAETVNTPFYKRAKTA